jgi:hypothetical protein
MNTFLRSDIGKEFFTNRSIYFGLETYIRLNIRQRGVAAPNTLRLALFAILGAVWEDCGGDLPIIREVAERLVYVF